MATNRTESINQFNDYIQEDFQQMLDSRLNEIDKWMSAQIQPNDWEIVTNVPISYSPGGWLERDLDEKVTHISVTVHFRKNGALRGTPQRIKFSPFQGFYNLREAVDCVMKSDIRDEAILDKENEFKVHSIMGRKTARIEVTLDDYRVKNLIRILVPMGFTGKSAQKVALQTVQEHYVCHNESELLDIALDNPGKELEDDS